MIFRSEHGGQLVAITWTYKNKDVYKKEWFDDYLEMPFDGFMVRVNKMYDEYLTYVYGDYMTFPQLKKSCSP